jgi:N-acetylglucosamine-6-sulfatase
MQTMQIDRDLTWAYDLKVPPELLFPDRPKVSLDRWMQNELARIPAGARAAVDRAYGIENARLAQGFAAMTPAEVTSWKFQRYAKDYLRTAQGVDDSVGGLLDELDRLGLARDTIVVYTSDQGWFLGEHGWFDKRWMYEESFRMPLVVRWPGVVPPGSTSDALVQNLDFAPTFLEAAGVAVPADMQGKSMVALLGSPGAAAAQPFRDAVYYRFDEAKGPHTVPRHEGIADPRYKLLRFVDLADADGNAVVEFYDLAVDPDERRDLSRDPAHAEVLSTLKAKLEAVRARYGAPADPPPTVRANPAAGRAADPAKG